MSPSGANAIASRFQIAAFLCEAKNQSSSKSRQLPWVSQKLGRHLIKEIYLFFFILQLYFVDSVQFNIGLPTPENVGCKC